MTNFTKYQNSETIDPDQSPEVLSFERIPVEWIAYIVGFLFSLLLNNGCKFFNITHRATSVQLAWMFQKIRTESLLWYTPVPKGPQISNG
jgi:hypothetical protein